MTRGAPQAHPHCSSSAGLQHRELLARAKVSWILSIPLLKVPPSGLEELEESLSQESLGGHLVLSPAALPAPLGTYCSPSVLLENQEQAKQVLVCRAKGTALPLPPLGDSSKCALHLVRSFAKSEIWISEAVGAKISTCMAAGCSAVGF